MIQVGDYVRIKFEYKYQPWYDEKWYKVVDMQLTVNKDSHHLILDRDLSSNGRVIWENYVESRQEVRAKKIKELFNG